MFTGIVEEIGTVSRLNRNEKGYDLAIRAATVLGGTILGDSICINGVCLTVSDLWGDGFTVGLSPETRRVTNMMALKAGSQVNLERALTPTSRLGGHFVQGHVDAVGTITRFQPDNDALWVTIEVPETLMRYVVHKGFITLDGTSLTVMEVGEDHFSVQLVAYTQTEITLPMRKIGDQINIEVDVLSKYVEKMLGFYRPAESKTGMTLDFLAENGYG